MPIAAEGTSLASGRPSGREIVSAIALAAVGFILTAGVLHAAIRDPLHLHADIRSEKLAMMEAWHGKVFSAAFGTSHIHDGFDPRVFDQTLAGSPLATRTANLGVEGGSQSEQFVMAQAFLKQLVSPAQAGAPAQPCLVILELSAGANFTNDHLVHPRAINIYDWPTTRLVTDFTSPSMSAEQRYGRVGYALAAMGLHYSNVGMLSNEIFTPPLNATAIQEQTADDMRGEDPQPYNASYLPQLYERVKNMPKQPAISPEQPLAGSAELVQRLAGSSPVANVSFAYVVMPLIDDMREAIDYPDHLTVAGKNGPIMVPIINLGRSDRFPQVFNPELWHDPAHFTGEGAKLVSQIMAEQLKQWYALHGEPPACG